MTALALQPPANGIQGDAGSRLSCPAQKTQAVWLNKINFAVEAADATRAGALEGMPLKGRYAWMDAVGMRGARALEALLEHPFEPESLAAMPQRVHFQCHAREARAASPPNPCGGDAGSGGAFIAPRVFSGTEETLRRFKLRWDQYMHHYVPLESNAHQWRGAKGWFADYTRAEPPRTSKSRSKKGSKRGGDDADFERFDRAPLIEAQIAANGETGAWTCACPSEEYVLNRMFNDELFPAERDADRIPETPTRWGGDDAGNLASAQLEGGYSLVPGLGLLPANARKREENPGDDQKKSSRDGLKRAPSVKGSEGSEKGDVLGVADVESFDGADRESYEASLVGPRVTPEGQPRLPKRASLGAATVNHNPARAWDMDPSDAASLVDAAARAAVGSDAVAVEYELSKAAPAPKRRAKLVLPPPEKYAGFMVDASEDKRGYCKRDARNPAGYAELPSMGLKKWRF